MAGRKTRYDKKKLEFRDRLWEDAEERIWSRKDENGFVTVPRTMTLLCTLIKFFGQSNDPSRVYLALWHRQRDTGFVEIVDPEELAAESGFYRGTRKTRSLHEALDQLEQLGFIRIRSKGTRKYAYVLILHPHDVVQRMRHEKKLTIPEWWWNLFETRAHEIGAVLRWKPSVKKPAAQGAAEFADYPEALEGDDDDLPF